MSIKFFVNRDATVRRNFDLVDPLTGDAESHWLELRAELTDAEYTEVETAMVDSVSAEGDIKINAALASSTQLLTWIKGWSLTTNSGAPCRPSKDQLEKLSRDAARVIRRVVEDHYRAVIAEKRLLTREEYDEKGVSLNGGGNPTASLIPFPSQEESSPTPTSDEPGTV